MIDLPLDVAGACIDALDGKATAFVARDRRVWQARRVHDGKGFEFLLIFDADDEVGVADVPLPFPRP